MIYRNMHGAAARARFRVCSLGRAAGACSADHIFGVQSQNEGSIMKIHFYQEAEDTISATVIHLEAKTSHYNSQAVWGADAEAKRERDVWRK